MPNPSVSLYCNKSLPPVSFAAAEIERAVIARGGTCALAGLAPHRQDTTGWRLILASTADEAARIAEEFGFEPLAQTVDQGYGIRVAQTPSATIAVLAADPVGAMYGGLDLAESIRLGTLDSLTDQDFAPHVGRRGIKFNIPLDARTPSYSDAADSAQQNIPEIWSMAFWQTYLDELARHRFNVLTLWSLHPFPSMVKVPEFPDVALTDVMRTRAAFDTSYSLCGHDMVRPETLADLEVVKRMSMDEKIAFWREAMQYAHDRGIEVYVFTWNIFTFGADGKHGITHAQDNPQTIAYFRASVREMILTYPLLAGIGITAGERMGNREDEYAKEKWLWAAYGEGVRAAKQLQPERQIRLIHRYHQTGLKSVLDEWQDYPGTFDLSYKYAIAHMYADPAPPFARSALAELPANLRLWMTVRNDDIYSFRWGDPDFARAFIRALPGPDQLAGYYMGPDGYTWGREFLSTEPESPRELVVQKQWYSFLLWGRLSYNPELPNAHFAGILAERFPSVDAATLFTAIQESSRIIPLVNRFHWEDLDFQWFPEACTSRPSYKGFHTVKHFMVGRTMRGSHLLSIVEHTDALLEGSPVTGTTPPQVVAQLRDHARQALDLAATLDPGPDRELRLTLGDVVAMAHLGNYYAAKIEGAAHLHRFDRTGGPPDQRAAIASLEQALDHWQDYAAVATRQYRPQLLTRIGQVDLMALTLDVAADIQIARDWQTSTTEQE